LIEDFYISDDSEFEENEQFNSFEGDDEFDEDYEYAFEKPKFVDEEDLDDSVLDFDFSEIRGSNFKDNFRTAKKKVRKPRRRKPLNTFVGVKDRARITTKRGRDKKIGKVLVPDDRTVIVEGVSRFILSKDKKDDALKRIGYYKGKKLKELIFTFNNGTAGVDFELDLFDPSMPLNYLYNTSQNLNDRVRVSGGDVSYSDVLFNILANPTMVVNARFFIAGSNITEQTAQPLRFSNKNIQGEVKSQPLNLNLQIDTMQTFSDTINFDIMGTLNRPFVPDGMDIARYKILAGNTVTMAFFYKQVSLKKVFLKEARTKKLL
jgi:hypothetical protein